MAQVPSNLIPISITQLPVSATTSEDVLLVGVYQGVTYKFRAGDLLQVAGVPTSRQVIAGTGLTGGGALATNVTLSVAPGGIGTTQLATTGVTPGVYGSGTSVPQLTVDATGRVTAATTVPLSISGYVPDTRQVIAGNGLTGGGALSSNVTLAVSYGGTPLTGTGTGSAGTALTLSRSDHRHPAVDLADQTQIDGILPIDQGGTGRSLVMQPGAVVWSGNDGLYISSAGVNGQVLISGGTGAPTWGSALVVSPQLANVVFAGPTAGSPADPTFRALVNADIPTTLSGKTLTSSAVTASTVDSTVIGGTTPAAGTFTTATATDVNATTVDTTNIEVTNLKAKDGTAAGSIANATGVVTLNSAVLTTADINGGTIDNTAIGGSTPSTGVFTQVDVDNLRLDGNTISTTNVDGNINLDPNGTGAVNIPAPVTNPTYIQMGSGSGTVLSAGRLWYDQITGSLNFGMGNGNITQQVGEEFFRYGKASAPISDVNLRAVYKTGTVGASGVITFAPTIAGITRPDQILGISTEPLNTNDFGRITTSGVVRGIDTTGSVYGEVWADNDDIWYNPVTGGLTKTEPVAPNIKLRMGTVINASGGGSGSFFVNLGSTSTLGGTDSNVQFGTLNNNDLIVYNSTAQYWTNAAQSTITAGSATNLAGGAANRLPYQTGSGATSFIAAPTVANTFLEWSGSAFQWSTNPLGTVTSVGLALPSEFIVSGSPVTSSGTLTGAWAAQTANYVFAGPTTGSAATPSFRALVAADVPTLNQNTTGSAASLSISGQTGLLTFTGLASTNRVKTVRDAADTILELGGSYTPTGTWNWATATVTWPTFNQNTTGQAGSVANALTAGSYLTSTGTFDGSVARTFAVDATSTNTASKVVARDASGNFAAGTITASLSGNATTATNLAGGAASQIPYQSAAGTTAFIANGTAGQVLTSAGAGTPVWSGISGGTF